MNWMRHWDLNDYRRHAKNYNNLSRYRSNIMYWMRHHVAASTGEGSCNLKDKYPNFEVGLKCILMVNPYLLVCSYIK